MKKKIHGFTLVEVIVSLALLAMVSGGFVTVVTAGTRITAKGYRLDQHAYININKIDNQEGTLTGTAEILTFYEESLDLAWEFFLYEYQVQSDTARYQEKYPMYYYRYQ